MEGGTPAADHRHLATSVAFAVAEAKGVEPHDLPSIEAVVDGDALDALFRGRNVARSGASVEFTFADCTVHIHADESVCIHADAATEPRVDDRSAD